MVKKRAFLTVTLLSLVPFGAQANVHGGSPGPRGQNYNASLVPGSARVTAPWSANPAVALSRDTARGVPTMLVSPSAAVPARGLSAEAAARFHLTNLRDAYKVPRAALTDARLRFVHDLGRGGVIVSLRQMLAGVEVMHGDIKILMDRNDHRLLGVAGAPHPAAVPGNRQRFALAKTAAITAALTDLYSASHAQVRLTPNGERRGGWEYFEASGGAIRFREAARVKPVYFPVGDALVAGWFVEVQVRRAKAEVDAFQYVVAADDGRLLYRRDLTDYDSNNYRVWADADGDKRPHDGPTVDWTPHPTGMPDMGPPGFSAPLLVAVDGLNTNPDNQSDPWLPPGVTETNGNNADAYVDWTQPDGLNLDMNEFRANTSAPNTFDYTYDPLLEPLANQTQSKGAIVQLFYDINWLHDWWYDSGFVEDTGVAQLSNYGRGGVEGDPIKAEAQDGAITGSRNNANMSTPADGEKPRMQMFLWNRTLSELTLDIQPSNLATTPNAAAFGPKNYDVMGEIVLADDGVAPNSDLCTDAVNDLTGKIALIDRGTCTFEAKVAKAQAAGAIAAIVANNTGGNLNPGMGLDPNTPDPSIPSVGITQDQGTALKAALQQPQTGHLVGSNMLLTERDGTIDNMIVAHEFGHYLHHRLQECGTKQCGGQSEGWGDFNAAMMALREGDDLDGVFSDSTYASFDETGYFGIRRVPYSVNFEKNAYTFKHVTDGVALPNTHPIVPNGLVNSQVHNTGEIWATTMWEAYIGLQKANQGDKTFAETNRAMSDYVVGGLMMTGIDPTFTETRDGILAVARAADEDDFLALANGFARRGMGSCAVSPDKGSQDFVGVVEDFELHANGKMAGTPTISDDIFSCDNDGVVDVGETGSVRVLVTNIGALPMPMGSTVEIFDAPATVAFPNGTSAAVEALEPYETIEVAIPITVVEPQDSNFGEQLKIKLTTPAGCVETSETFLPTEFNADLAVASASFDDVEPTTSAWTIHGALSEVIWARQPSLDDGWFWHGADIGTDTDTWLESPTVNVSDADPFTISFDHAFSFEFSDNTFWDGGVVEVTVDDGVTWEDATVYGAAPTYLGAINSMANPINGKQAYVHRNAAYPDREAEVLEFGTALAGEAVKFRFRIGTDAAAGDLGWDIDNINFEGVTNTPFNSWIPDEAVCVPPDSTTGETTDSSGGTDTGTSSGTDTGTSSGSDTGTSTSTSTSTDTTQGLEDSGDESNTVTLTDSGVTDTSAGPTDPGESDTGGEPVPTTMYDPSNPDPDDDSGDSDGDSETENDSDTALDDEGCGCDVDSEHGWGWQVAPWLALLGLKRRRRV